MTAETTTDPLDFYERRAMDAADLDTYEARAIEAARLREEAERMLAAIPECEKTGRHLRAAVLLDELRAAQSREACARHDVFTAEAELARWRHDHRVRLARVLVVPLGAPCVAVAALAVWTVSLTITLLGLVAFCVLWVFRSSRAAHLAAGSALHAAERVGLVGVDIVRDAARSLTTPGRAARRGVVDAAVDAWEDAAVALLQAERDMPYTQVLPLAGLTEAEAARVELGVAVLRRASR